MQLPKGATIAVADGEKLNLFHNTGDVANPKLAALPGADVVSDNKGSGARHQSSSANPDNSQVEEVITQALYERRLHALTVARIVRKTVAPGVRRAVSTTVRIAASPSAAHVAR